MGIFASAGFGAFWAATALSACHGRLAVPGYLVAFAILAALVVAGGQLMRVARRGNLPDGADPGDRRRTRRRFLVIFVAEIAAMNVAAWWLVPQHMAYLIPAIALIVGVHFYPLASLFRAPHYRLTATAMTLASLAAVAAIALGCDGNACNALLGTLCALALWISGFVSWRSMRHRLARPAARAVAG
jgi:hypothetical protein